MATCLISSSPEASACFLRPDGLSSSDEFEDERIGGPPIAPTPFRPPAPSGDAACSAADDTALTGTEEPSSYDARFSLARRSGRGAAPGSTPLAALGITWGEDALGPAAAPAGAIPGAAATAVGPRDPSPPAAAAAVGVRIGSRAAGAEGAEASGGTLIAGAGRSAGVGGEGAAGAPGADG